MTRLRVLIADQHPSVRENLRYFVGAEADLEVVGVATDGVSALRMAIKLRPDVLVTDYELPDYDALAVARILRREQPQMRVVLYLMNIEVCAAARAAGIDACVSKDADPTVLLRAIRGLSEPPPSKRPRVLVVEDDRDTRAAIRTALEEDGLQVVETGDGFEALVECELRAPSVVVLDLGLPMMNGEEFVSAFRQLRTHDAPIVVLSAKKDGRQIAKDLGAAAFLAKPFSISELSETVLRVTPT
jgi:DNA-binding NarL/FixJ family response regulator